MADMYTRAIEQAIYIAIVEMEMPAEQVAGVCTAAIAEATRVHAELCPDCDGSRSDHMPDCKHIAQL